MIKDIKQLIKSLSSVHRPDGSPNVFLFATPRSGSTWLMELICSQPGFKSCSEPLDLRDPAVRRSLGFTDWRDLYNSQSVDRLRSYFAALCEGRLRSLNPNPFGACYRPVTRRIVFKLLHGFEHRINWFRDTFNGRIVYLIRHPIAVTLSREELPTLEVLLDKPYRQNFSPAQLAYASEIVDSGTGLERGVLAWCLQNAVPLRDAEHDWAVVSYEQLVVDPEPVIQHLAQTLELSRPEHMLGRMNVPSSVKRKSDGETQRVLESGDGSARSWLIEKWRSSVSADEERSSMEILERFGIDVYRFGETVPIDWAWIRAAPAAAAGMGGGSDPSRPHTEVGRNASHSL